MPNSTMTRVILVAAALAVSTLMSAAYSFEKLAPFSDVQWSDAGDPIVMVDGRWYRALRIDGIAVDKILKFSRESYGRKARSRFANDLVELMSDMGQPTGSVVDLDLLDIETGSAVRLKSVAMTAANRSAIKAAEMARLSPAQKRDERDEPAELAADTIIAGDALREDIAEVQRQLGQRFAYADANGVDSTQVATRLRRVLGDSTTVGELKNEVAKVIASYIDGHAGPRVHLADGRHLPFAIHMAGERYVAVGSSGSSLVDSEFPFVRSIDGLTVEQWMAKLDRFIVRGSPQSRRYRALRILSEIDGVRTLLGRPVTDHVDVQLASSHDDKTKQIALRTADRRIRPEIPVRDSGVLEGNVGYLKIASFRRRDNIPALVAEWMPKFRDTNGLIIDIRGNGGGNRIGALALIPYFMRSGEAYVGNVSAYRLYREFDKDHLGGSRYAYRETSDHWTAIERKAIESTKRTFSPDVLPPAAQFSDWHYLVFSKSDGDTRYDYQKPVVVLIDEGCFSATDIFAGAIKGLRNVTLMGQPTSGGSARSVSELLPNSGIKVTLASMMSFQPDGLLYDGRGIVPDVYVVPEPGTFVSGGVDNLLQEALRHIQ